jgi:hypothetical protein
VYVRHLADPADRRSVVRLADPIPAGQGRARGQWWPPHHRDRRDHDAQLDVLIPAADGLITLTAGAAAEIESRWGRQPLVLPHPHVVAAVRGVPLTWVGGGTA